jgi:formiminoglutamase
MNIKDFIDPVSLEKPDEYYIRDNKIFSKNIKVHTLSEEIEDLSNYDIAIIGVPEDRNSHIQGASLAPNLIRNQLYQLYAFNNFPKIVDLGNVKQGNTYKDTYVALTDVITELRNNQVVVLILGGTQDLTIPAFKALEKNSSSISVITVDSILDIDKDAVKTNNDSFLNEILFKKNSLFIHTSVGHQLYLNNEKNVELINNLSHNTIRLGEIRSKLMNFEPYARDADLLSFDMGAIRQSDSPASSRPSPNGFYGEEACTIARYAGNSNKLSVFGLFEIYPQTDMNEQSCRLAAQICWHFIYGLGTRKEEIPSTENKNFRTFIVGHSDMDHEITFYKSVITERWWMNVPNIGTGSDSIISCSEDDYITACNHEIPDLWWKIFQKLN